MAAGPTLTRGSCRRSAAGGHDDRAIAEACAAFGRVRHPAVDEAAISLTLSLHPC